MGSVWLAKNEVTERDFAIKFLHPSDQRSEGQLSRFFQEAKVAGKLRHPSVVEIFDAGTEPNMKGAPYLVMELLDGIGLDQAIVRAGALPLGTSLEIMVEICRGLALAHDKGILHRDLKPSNVFLHRVGSGALVPKVLDFGISKVLIDGTTGKQKTGMTRTGAVLGSPLYMSPEQAAGDKTIDARSDVHSLGVMLWECLTGRAPFTAETYGLLLVEIIQGERPRLSDVLPAVPPSVARVVDRAIARDRSARFANAGELAAALDEEIVKLGHVPSLAARTGADAFFATIGAGGPETDARATSTTAAVEVPSQDGRTRVAAAQSGVPRTPPPAAIPTPNPSSAAVPKKSLVVPVVLGLGGLTAVVAIVAVVAMNKNVAPSAASAEPGTENSATAAPPIAPLMSAPEPTPSATPSGVVPDSSAAPKLAIEAKPAGRPKSPQSPTAPKEPKVAKPGASAPDVHHGVTSSGL